MSIQGRGRGRESLFFQDLGSPISLSGGSGRRGKISSPGQAAAVSALWRDNFGSSDLPPPPVFTLDDRSDFSPESDYPLPPDLDPIQHSNSNNILKGNSEGSKQSWWSPSPSSSKDEKRKNCSPVEGVVQLQSAALITLPPPTQVARPDMETNTLPTADLYQQQWLTVYGFSPADTNSVIREFEKCGVILKHVPGPRDANWMHILYQNRSDAQKALSKNGMQINGILIIGVKEMDPMQRQALNDRLNNQGFMTLPPHPSTKSSEVNSFTLGGSSRSYANTSAKQSVGAIASPTKSLASKIMDLMFGV